MTARRTARKPAFLATWLAALLPFLFMLALPAGAAQAAATGAHGSKQHATKAKQVQTSRAKSKKTRKAVRRRAVVDDGRLKSRAVLVVDQDTGEIIETSNPDMVVPIASLTKLMTALVVIDSGLPMDETLEITQADVDTEKNTHSRLKVGTQLTRDEMLLLALMSSENRAAMALSRNYPGGREAFLAWMNSKAQALGMTSSHFADAAGLSPRTVSTARDLQKLLRAAYAQPLIREYSTHKEEIVMVGGRPLTFISSNRLVRKTDDSWEIGLQKTGFTNEAGRCLMMQATVLGRRLSMIFLDSTGTLTRYADAMRIRKRIETEARALERKVSLGGPGVASAATRAVSAP